MALPQSFDASRASVEPGPAPTPAVSDSEPSRLAPIDAVGIVRPRRAAPAEAARTTRAEINLGLVRHNLRELQAFLAARQEQSERHVRIWAVLKADGYGHGATAIGTTLERAGVDGLCVALLEEGIELREAGIRCPVLVMGGYYGHHRESLEALIENRLTPVVYDGDQLRELATTLRYLGQAARLGVHLKIDTGMSRLGVRHDQLAGVLDALARGPELELQGLMTQLACADADGVQQTEQQLQHFEQATRQVELAGFRPRFRHAANSAALLRMPQSHFDVVRPGIALFGLHPCVQTRPGSTEASVVRLKPVMRVLTEIVALRGVPAGTAVGYGHQWRATRPSQIATIPIGYADGLDRALSSRGHVLVCGKRASIVGAVSMDLTTIDVTDVPGVRVRDEVVVLGSQRGRLGSDEITAGEIAAHTGSISWEVLTSVSRRVPRFYRQP